MIIVIIFLNSIGREHMHKSYIKIIISGRGPVTAVVVLVATNLSVALVIEIADDIVSRNAPDQ